MRVSTDFADAVAWAQRHFGDVRLGDVRRTRRVCRLAASWARQPGASIPRLGGGPPDWQTLWHGLVYLRHLVEGIHLAAQWPR